MLCLLVFHFRSADVGHFFIERFGAVDRGTTDRLVPRLVVLFQRDLRKVGGGLVVLVLRPSLKRMIVALVAVESHAQEQMGCVLKGIFRSPEDLEIRCRRVFSIGAGGCYNLVHELVVGFVAGNAFTDPLAEHRRALFAQELGIHLQQIGPFAGPVVDKRFARDQLVDKLLAFFLSRCCVG